MLFEFLIIVLIESFSKNQRGKFKQKCDTFDTIFGKEESESNAADMDFDENVGKDIKYVFQIFTLLVFQWLKI